MAWSNPFLAKGLVLGFLYIFCYILMLVLIYYIHIIQLQLKSKCHAYKNWLEWKDNWTSFSRSFVRLLPNVSYFSYFALPTLKSNSYLQTIYFYLLQWESSKSDEKCFLFHPKSSFGYWYIYIFVLTFWLCRKTSW